MSSLIKSIKSGKGIIRDIFRRINKRDFSGNTGQAVKNSSYQLTQNLLTKIGSLLFTIIIARILLPDKMGLYNLALSTIVLFSIFSDLGVGTALFTFVSKALGKNNPGKAKSYLKKLLRWKIYLLLISGGILGVSAYFIANYYYQKPIFFALLAGIFYIPIQGIVGVIESLFKINNDFKTPLYKEIIFQISRFFVVPLIILLLLKFNLSNQKIIFVTLMTISFLYFLIFIYLSLKAKGKIKFLKVKEIPLNRKEKKNLIKFILPLTTISLSGVFFGYIDTLMLGHYVSEKFIAYYGAAFSLVGAASVLIGFTSLAVFPIFARESGKKLESIFKQTRNFTFLLSVLGAIFTYFVAYYVIRLAYGIEYLPSVGILKIFAILVMVSPLTGLYDIYYTLREKTKTIMWLLIVSTVINIILNIIGITYGLNNYGEIGAVYGACIATIISRVFYLIGGVVFRKK